MLLNTHTKRGQTYLDDLASDGYYRQFNDLPKPLFIDGKAQPVFDTNHLIHEVVYVESPLDTDHDGQRDLVKTDVIRPSETNHGLKVPTLFTASPYNMGTNDHDGQVMTHNVNVPLKHKQPNHNTYQDIEAHVDPTKNLPKPRTIKGHAKRPEQSFHHEWTYTMNDYFLARGFAVVYSAGIGTLGSQGLKTTGDPAEVISAKSVVEWLAGDRTAFTDPISHVAVKAWWSNRNVAMTGRSYLGTLSTAVAATGVKGLKTCIVEAAISSWYDYYRENGLVCAAGGFQGEDADVLAEEVFSRQKRAGDYHRIKPLWKKQLKKINHAQHRDTGAYNPFWDARNYRKNLKHTKADLLFVHGLNDINVKPFNVERSWKALKNVPVTKKLILHQGQHIYINNFQSIDFTDMVNLWISNKLYGVDNSADQIIPPVTIQDNAKPETWHTFNDWCNSHHHITYYLNHTPLDPESYSQAPQSYHDFVDKKSFHQYCHHSTAGTTI
ncbi:MAG: Xaa-Pro dipeptidyl-peptidase [Acetilactobacillus jinshanensis]